MGYKEDQNYFSETHRPEPVTEGRPPPLPPRGNSSYLSPGIQAPPSYTDAVSNYHSQPLTHSWSAQDPRSSSTQSLVPEEHSGDDKRTLFLVYIHGFMGNETSFQSFPAHIHNFVTVTLADTHHVHTKIYPRYKSRKAVEYARDDFSKWLRPHEAPTTDVILVGHSMGGILSAEVALLESQSMQNTGKTLRHRITGTINFDTPFLGMHPGVVISGIGSLFRPAPDTPGASSSGAGDQELRPMPLPDQDSSASAEVQRPSNNSSPMLLQDDSRTSHTGSPSSLISPVDDPNYNPPFQNDVRMATRTGWGNALHFLNKHSDGLARATRSYVTSYFEFGGCLADYNGLKNRYSRLRNLEETDSRRRASQRRVRFVNYYTASTGRPRKPKLPPKIEESETEPIDPSEAWKEALFKEGDMQTLTLSTSDNDLLHPNPAVSRDKNADSPVQANADHFREDSIHEQNHSSTSAKATTSESGLILNVVDATPISEDEHLEVSECKRSTAATESALPLPPIPDTPQEPSPFDVSKYRDKDARKLAEKEHSRQVKAYERAVKDRDKAIIDRRKLLEKREKDAKQALEKQRRLEEKEIAKTEKKRAKEEAETFKKVTDDNARVSGESLRPEAVGDYEAKIQKAKKDKKFCMLPPKVNGEVDPCWVRVYMPGVDEVGAHCGLFFVGEQYEWLVSDVGRRIQEWVQKK